MRILIPVDGTKPSLHALDFLASSSDLVGSDPEITILNVQPPVPPRIYALEQPDGVEQYYKAEAGQVMTKVEEQLPKNLSNCKLIYKVGHPADVIAETADAMDADLIIIGTKGHRALSALLFGSVSNSVLARVRRPILMLREKLPTNSKQMRVGVAVDGSAYSERAVNYIINHRDLFGQNAKFTLIHAATDFSSIVMPSMAGVPIRTMNRREVTELQEESFEMAIKPLEPLLKGAGVEYDVARVQGNPGDAIAKYAKDNQLDLIVMGSHGYDNLDAVLLGSVAMRIAAISKEPLLIIR